MRILYLMRRRRGAGPEARATIMAAVLCARRGALQGGKTDFGLTAPGFRGRIVVAKNRYPLFGTMLCDMGREEGEKRGMVVVTGEVRFGEGGIERVKDVPARNIARRRISSFQIPARQLELTVPGAALPREGFRMKKALALVAAAAAMASFASPSIAAPDGKNRKVTVENLSSQPVHYLYASPVTSNTWEEDLLGETGTIPAGTSKIANIDNGTTECYYDLKAKMKNGQEHVQRRINVCAVSKWVIGDSGNSVQ